MRSKPDTEPQQTERLLASELLARAEDSDVTTDELLALIHYAIEKDTDRILAAREQGAAIGNIGQYMSTLKSKAQDTFYHVL